MEETDKIAAGWLAEISSKYAESGEAVIAGLSGHLGAGKTAFVKAVARAMGIKETVTSPTFVIMKIYETLLTSPTIKHSTVVTAPAKFSRLVHIDAYRLENAQELEALRFEELVTNKNNLIMVEWPENVGLRGKESLRFKLMGENEIQIKD